MTHIEYDGKVDENDLWKLFSDDPDKPSETILFFSQLQPLLKPITFEDESRRFLLFEHGVVQSTANGPRMRAIVTQRNLRTVAKAMAKACQEVAIQYLGRAPA
ncbi:hypothetical protein [Pseudooceanicola algae]|uniref:hypothetical protein n=1 Tax=Pseudooceanicola algae TaxID=1537215 RepID=UPI000E6C375F|nr:hypothetical protein [Pseudooceanicola algae]